MTALDSDTDTSPSTTYSDLSSSPFSFSVDSSPFLNLDQDFQYSEHEKTIVFRSLVATVKFQPALDDTLEAKAVKFIKSFDLKEEELADAFLHSLASSTDESLKNFVQCIVVLISSPSQIITTTAMKMLVDLVANSSTQVRLALVTADLIPQLIVTLNPLSLSFTEGVDIHTGLIRIITWSVWLSLPYHLTKLGIEDDNGQQAVHETVLQQVLAPSEQYISYLCVNRYSIVGGDQSRYFLLILAQLLRVYFDYHRTREFVLHMPVILTIPSCFAFFENDCSVCNFQSSMMDILRKVDKQGGEVRQMWKIVSRMLRMEGIEDVMEEKLRNHRDQTFGGAIVTFSIKWNNMLGMNLTRRA